MDAIYPSYATSDPHFYDKPHRLGGDETRPFAPSGSAEWAEWVQSSDETWSFWSPSAAQLPEQGWKIHISATLLTAEHVLEVVSSFSHREGLPFKFLRNRGVLQATLSKDGDRRVSGKFITVYPTSAADLHAQLTELDASLAGLHGPYVLTDLRWQQGPLFVRYGAFSRRSMTVDGVDVPAIRDLDTGALVPDVRAPGFHVPPWVRVPAFLAAELDALAMTPPDGFPLVLGALHFSNAGGVYDAELDGLPVILKEARPHVGLTPDGRDAVQRLRHEASVLQELHGRVPVPKAVASFTAHDHTYLAMERVDAVPLSAAVGARNPLASADHSLRSRIAYRDWAVSVTTSLRCAVTALHNAGRVHGDLHPANVLVRYNNTVVLIDFEMSRRLDEDGVSVIGAPGFVATDGRCAVEQDLYALACIELFMFVPLIPLLSLDGAKVGELLSEAMVHFPLDQGWAVAQMTTFERRASRVRLAPDVTPRRGIVADVVESLLADATPDREDRLWPGDPTQFSEPATSIAHGALGVLTALRQAGMPPTPQQLTWVTAAARRAESPVRFGLYDGVAGEVWAYRALGLDEQTDRRLALLSTAPLHQLGFDLYGGLPGIGLALLAESHPRPNYRDVAIRIASTVGERWRTANPPSQVPTGAGGLLRGATGSALLGLRLYEATGDPNHLRIATDAIDYDLHSLRKAPDGSLQIDEGWRLLPYLGSGSAGVGIVLAQLLKHLPGHSRYLEILNGIARAATAPLTVLSGLFQGRAGLIQLLLTLERSGLASNSTSAALHAHVSALSLHALRHGDRIRFAGDGLLRASCDLATGSAGVLATLTEYAGFQEGRMPGSDALPYLTPFSGVEDRSPLPAASRLKEVR